MYEEIMRNSRNSFFVLLNEGFDDYQQLVSDLQYEPGEDKSFSDNEWLQEYRIIYNSYVLDGKEPEESKD